MTHPGSCVGRVPIFAGLTTAQQGEVARLARPLRLDRGEVAQRPGERAGMLLVVHSGALRVSRVAPGGQEQVLRVLRPGDFVGEIGFVTGDADDRLAVSVEPAEVCSFRHRDLEDLVTRFPDIGLRMLRAVTRRLSAAEASLAAVSGADAGARVAGYLLELPARWSDGRPAVTFPVPKRDVASLLGLTPETLSRRLGALSRAGLIRVDKATVVLHDPEGLARIAETQ